MTSEFDRIKKECMKKNILWEDPNFFAVQTTIFYHQTPPFTFHWKRITEIKENAHFLDETESFDIVPGRMGDQWLVSCLGVLHSVKNLFYRVVPADQSTEKSYGIYKFRLWWFGEWLEVLVDDKLPTVNGKLIFLQPLKTMCFWGPLLEKAIAKLHGSYEALKYGSRSDTFTDLFGGIVETLNTGINGEPIQFMQLQSYLDETCIVTCVSVKKNVDYKDRLPNGLYYNLNYRVCALDKVETPLGEIVQLVKLKDTKYGVKSNQIFEWSTFSQSWDTIPVLEKNRLLMQLQEGEFWISFSTFVQLFTNLDIIHLDVNTAKDEQSLINCSKKWQAKVHEGQWKRGVSAGGCRNHKSFHINPQFLLTLSSSEELVIGLSQHSAVEPRVIGFSIYQLYTDTATNTNESLPEEFFKSQISFMNSDYGNSRHVSLKCTLDKGKYLLMPTTYEPGEESCFTLRIFGLFFQLSQLETRTMLLLNPFSHSNFKNESYSFKTKKCQYEAVFMQLANESKSINCFELLELLDACLPNDYIKGCANIEICRQVIALQDKTGVGRINFGQFKMFMINLKSWQGVFKIYTKEKSGVLRAEKLRDALCDVGFQLNRGIMNVVMNRYIRKDGTLRLSDYISAILHLTTAFELFRHRDYNQDNMISMEMSDWIRLAMLC